MGVQGQKLTETKIAGLNAAVWNPTIPSSHAILFLPGLGGEGTTFTKLYSQGLPKFLKNSTLKLDCNVLAVQPIKDWPNAILVNNIIADILARYPNIKTLALTGLSAGAAGIFNAIEQGKYRALITSVVVFSMDRGGNPWPTTPYAKINFWGLCGKSDSRFLELRDFVAKLKSQGYQAQFTEYTGGHCCWDEHYNPASANGREIYKFLAGKIVTPPPVVDTPVVIPPGKKNWQDNYRTAKRVGPPKTHYLKPTSPGNMIYPYLAKLFDIQGGDTIKVQAGTYQNLYLAGFGGDYGAKVIVVPGDDKPVIVTGTSARIHIGKGNSDTKDSNTVNHVEIDGTYLRSKGIKYGFQSTSTGWGLVIRNASDITIKGCSFIDNSLGVQMKMYSDSASPWTLPSNFRQKNIKIIDNLFRNIKANEGAYIGHTSPSGAQAGNDGPTVRGDSIEIAFNIFDGTGWDAIQTSNARHCEIHDNIVLNSSRLNVSSQNWGILLGGNCTGKIYNNFVQGGTGTIGSMGYGQVEVFNNYIGNSKGSAMYFNQTNAGISEKNPPLQLNVHDNIISNAETNAFMHGNTSKLAVPGVFTRNIIVGNVNRITSNAGDAITGNVLIEVVPVILNGTAIDPLSMTAAEAIQKVRDALTVVPPKPEPPIIINPKKPVSKVVIYYKDNTTEEIKQ
jgi:hypothetical protein